MRITRNSIETVHGPREWFTGDVYIDAVAAAPAPARVQANLVHFTPGARTAWHTHPRGQTIYVTEGIGLCQRRGGPIEVIRPGDRVFFEPDEDHWHGAAPNRFMVRLALMRSTTPTSLSTGARRSPTTNTPRHQPPTTRENTSLELRQLGRTGVQVSKLCLGAMMFGGWGNKDHDDSVRIIHRALDGGINFIDTADIYSQGESEEIVGKALAGGKRDQVVLATKVWGPMGEDPQPARRLALLDHPGGRELAAAARHRLDRPLPDPPL